MSSQQVLSDLARVTSMHKIMTYANNDAPPQSMLMMIRHHKPTHATTKIRPERYLLYYLLNSNTLINFIKHFVFFTLFAHLDRLEYWCLFK
jgi:hypothetical protein